MSKPLELSPLEQTLDADQLERAEKDKETSYLMSNIAIADITKVNVDQFAKQITLIEISYFSAIKRSEFLSLKWNGRDKNIYAPNIVASTRWFNQLNFWVQKEILKYPAVNKRTELLSYFVKLAKRLVDLNNLYSAMSIVSALQVECIYRLRHTWSGLGHRERSAYRRLEELFGQQENCRLLREHTSAMPLPGIPYLGVYLSDLTYTNVTHPRINGQPTTVWVTKLNAIVDAIAHFQQSRFIFPCDEPIRRYLLAQCYIEELQKFLEDANFKTSLSLEPPIPLEPSSDSNTLSPHPIFGDNHRFNSVITTRPFVSANNSPTQRSAKHSEIEQLHHINLYTKGDKIPTPAVNQDKGSNLKSGLFSFFTNNPLPPPPVTSLKEKEPQPYTSDKPTLSSTNDQCPANTDLKYKVDDSGMTKSAIDCKKCCPCHNVVKVEKSMQTNSLPSSPTPKRCSNCDSSKKSQTPSNLLAEADFTSTEENSQMSAQDDSAMYSVIINAISDLKVGSRTGQPESGPSDGYEKAFLPTYLLPSMPLRLLPPSYVVCEGALRRKPISHLIPPGFEMFDVSTIRNQLSGSERMTNSTEAYDMNNRIDKLQPTQRFSAWKSYWAVLIVTKAWSSANIVYFESSCRNPTKRIDFSKTICEVQSFKSSDESSNKDLLVKMPIIGLARHRNGNIDESSFLLTHLAVNKTYRMRPFVISENDAPKKLSFANALSSTPLKKSLRKKRSTNTRQLCASPDINSTLNSATGASENRTAICSSLTATTVSRSLSTNVPCNAVKAPLNPTVADWLIALQTTFENLNPPMTCSNF